MRARVYITPKQGILDPQGQAIERALHALGFGEAGDVHLGKYVELSLAGLDRARAEQRTDEMCRQLLANGVIEDYRFEIEE
jgi:phosphoribosylformylglycinamidine synthase subunit PurS